VFKIAKNTKMKLSIS